MEATLPRIDSGISFRNAANSTVRGSLLHLSRDAIVFEVYSPYPVAEAGDTLRNVQILHGGKPAYSGDAVVRATLATGMTIILTASPLGAWSPIDEVAPGRELSPDARALILEWGNSRPLLPEYQIAVSNLRAYLSEMSQWLAPLDAATASAHPPEREDLVTPIAEELYAAVYPRMKQMWDQIEHAMHRVAPEDVGAHRMFIRRELHPLLLCCPLVHRTYVKPLGYAGDYGMVNMILGNKMEGPNMYARVANAYYLRIDVAEGHRNRIETLVDLLRDEARRCRAAGRTMRVLNVGCGPAEEICRFIRRDELADHCEFVLMDFNEETLAYAREQITAAMRQSGRRPKIEFMNRSVNDLLKDAIRVGGAEAAEDFDFAYCAGLFDYLSDRVCARLTRFLVSRVVPGGRAVVTNVHRQHKSQAILDDLVEWHLILRNEADMREMVTPELGDAAISTEPAGVNLFLDIRKHGAPHAKHPAVRRHSPALEGVS